LRGRETIERKMLEIDCCEGEKMKIERERRTIERKRFVPVFMASYVLKKLAKLSWGTKIPKKLK
jgi:hypothetical protein